MNFNVPSKFVIILCSGKCVSLGKAEEVVWTAVYLTNKFLQEG